ncbi:TPR repeat-containing protein [Flavobacterium swingsii]|uniref:histidine kinase n=1 Tax=Flavobacterium swingsii TaxID=498292 RepID=A0A1I0ZR78_9FLAO|nr:TPR repeat-containing protein [Flavobacterium swingsii]
MHFKKNTYKLLLALFLVASQFCFGFQSQSFGEKTKTDSVSYYIEKNNLIKALDYARKKSDYYLETKNYAAYCDMMIQKSEVYRSFNDMVNTIKTLYEARNIAETNHLLEKQALVYRGIGNINGIIFEYTKGKKYLHKANKIALQLKNNDLLIKTNQGLTKIFFETQSDSTLYYLNKVDFYTKKSKNLRDIALNQNNFYNYYTSKNNNIKAKKHLDSSYTIALKIGDKALIASGKNNLGVYYMTVEKDYEKSKQEYLDIIKMFPNGENSMDLSQAYLNISYAYEKLGDYKNAYSYNNKYLDLLDEKNANLYKSNQEIEIKYAINKVENEFKEKEKAILEKQEKNQKLLLLFASLFILAGFIFYFYYQNLLLKQKGKLKDIDTKLQYKIISATLDGQDEERNKISAVLHDHVSAVLSSVGLHLSAFESSLTKEQVTDLKKTRALLKDAHDKVRDLSHELVPPLLVKFGLQFALKDLCENNTNSLVQFNFHSTLANDRRFNGEFETKMFFIVSELLNNVMKHSKASKSKLLLEEIDGKLVITIEDNGIGFDSKNISMSDGFGITQIRARIKNMQGDMKIKSKIGQGTTIIIKTLLHKAS